MISFIVQPRNVRPVIYELFAANYRIAASSIEMGYCAIAEVAINRLISPFIIALLKAVTNASNWANPEPHNMRNCTAIISIKAVLVFLFLWASRFFRTILLIGISYLLIRVTILIKALSREGINIWSRNTMPTIIANKMDIKMKKKSIGIL